MSDPIPMRPLPARQPPYYHADELIAGAIVVERRRLLPLTQPVGDCGNFAAAVEGYLKGAYAPVLTPPLRRAALIRAAAYLLLEVQRLDETRERAGT